MADFSEKIIEYRLKHFINIYKNQPKNVIIFGLNGHIGQIVNRLRSEHIDIIAIFDNNPLKQNKVYENISVKAPDGSLASNAYVIIASAYFDEMKSQLVDLEFDNRNIFDLLGGDSNNGRDLLEFDIINAECQLALNGYEVFKRIAGEKSRSCTLFLAPVGSVGDIYLLCLYFERFLVEKGIKEYTLAIPSRAGNKVARLFGYNSISISQEEADALIKYRLVMGAEQAQIYVLHCGYLHIRIPCFMLMYKKSTWIENYRSVLFELSDTRKKEFSWPKLTDAIVVKLKEIGFEPGRSVVISPYANTLAGLDVNFWKKLVRELQNKGFKCYTNVTASEKEIEGTGRLEIDIEYIVKVVEFAGYFIALRSGLCDIVSSANCKKIVLYTQEKFETIKVIDFYSLKQMGLCDDAVELEVTYDYDKDVKRVLDEL